jgi:hypothetical protein
MPLDASVISLEKLLIRYPRLDVPNYQRTFKWPEEQISNLFQDILNGLDFTDNGDSRGHFLGSIVVCNDETSNKLDLVDGQQRLTSLTLMLWSLAKLADSRVQAKARTAIMQNEGSNPRILHKSENSVLCSDREAYREVITNLETGLNPGNIDPLDEETIQRNYEWQNALSESCIFKASRCLDALAVRACELLQRDARIPSRSKAAEMIYKRIADGVKLIIIETNQRKEGMRVFASINAQGTKLEPWELIMSAFYTHGTSDRQQKAVQLTFESDQFSISKVLGAKNDDTAVNNGLRTYWVATRRLVSMDDLFHDFNEVLSKQENQETTHASLLKQILYCVPLLKGFDNAPNRQASILRGQFFEMECLYPLTVAMKDKLARPILLSVLLHLQNKTSAANETLRRVSFALERARMRLVICKYASNFIDKSYAQIANDIYHGRFTDDPDEIERRVYKAIGNIKGFPGKEELELAFQRFNAFGKDKKITAVIATRLQDALRNPDKLPFLYLRTPKRDDDSFELVRGLKYSEDISTDREARRLGFNSFASLELIGSSLGNLFMADPETGEIDHGIKFNGNTEIADLGEEAMAERRDMLAELATRIWHF